MKSWNFSINKENSTFIVLCMFLLYPAIQGFIWKILSIMTGPFGIVFDVATVNAVVWLMVVLPWLILNGSKFRKSSIALYLALNFAVFISFIFTKYEGFTTNQLLLWIFTILPAFCFGCGIDVNENILSKLYPVAIFAFLVTVAYRIYGTEMGRDHLADEMGKAYAALPSVLIIIENAFTKKRRMIKYILAIASVMFLVILGTRGPILCTVILFILILIHQKGFTKTVAATSITAITAYILLASAWIKSVLIEWAYKIFGSNSRIVEMFVAGDITSDNGRDVIFEKVIDAFWEAPLAIRGLYADRIATSNIKINMYTTVESEGTYVHNLWLELLVDFGIVFGGAIIVWLVFKAVQMLVHVDSEKAWIVRVLICLVFVKLTFSSTFTSEKNFFFIIGMMMNRLLNNRSKIINQKVENNAEIVSEKNIDIVSK